MLLVTEALPARVASTLLRYNIRFVEQFLSMMESPATVNYLAQALDCPPENLEDLAREVISEHPEVSVPQRSDRDYSMGYGKKSDWEKRFR